MSPSSKVIEFTIFGQAYSKANSRKIVEINGKTASIKSDRARIFERDGLRQIPPCARVRSAGPVSVTLRMFYASERSDLDESLVLDLLQDRYKKVVRVTGTTRELCQRGVYMNDRQVREKHIFHAIDPVNPRVEVKVEPRLVSRLVSAIEKLS